MREQTIRISERDLMYCVGGQLFDQAPNRQPRKAEIIMQKVRDAFRAVAHNDNEYYTYAIPQDKLYVWLAKLLKDIPEFNGLNLTLGEYEAGVGVEDETRGRYKFTSAYDVNTPDSWKHDFIDLDAFIQNVHRMLIMHMDMSQDCMGCVLTNTDVCKTCSVNKEITCKYMCTREPRGRYTFACAYDCFKGYYICCEECSETEDCAHRCLSASNKCGNKLGGK